MSASYDQPYIALLRREVLTMMRHPWTFLLIGASVALTAFFVAEQWPQGQLSTSEQARQAQMLFVTFQFFAYAALFIFIPVIAANSIAQERRAEAVDMLRMTAISGEGIVAGKTLNTIALYIVLLLANLPVLGVVFFLVGIEVWPVLFAVLTALTITVASALMSIYFSIRIPNVIRALLATYVSTAILVYVVGMIVYGVLLVLLSLVVGLIFQLFYGNASDAWQVGGFLAIPAAVSLLGFIAYRRAVEAWNAGVVQTTTPTNSRPVYKKRDVWRRKTTWPFYLLDPLRRKPPMRDGWNPILLREMRWGVMQNRTLLVRFFYVSLFVYFIPAGQMMGIYDFRDAARPLGDLLTLELAVLALFVPAMIAFNVLQERDHGNLDMLRMTLQSNWNIFCGKILAGYQAASPFLISSLLIGILCSFLLRDNALAFLAVKLFALLLVTGLCTGFGLLGALLAPRAVSVITLTYAMTWTSLWALPAGIDFASTSLRSTTLFENLSIVITYAIERGETVPMSAFYTLGAYVLLALLVWTIAFVLFEYRYARDR